MQQPKPTCYHCGDDCPDNSLLYIGEKEFCCNGCKQVYLLLNDNNLCDYYTISKTAGIKAKGKFISEKFGYLDDPSVTEKLINFTDGSMSAVCFELPQMHCASCVYLLENLHSIEPGILSSSTNFLKKEIFIRYNPKEIGLRKIAELLAFIGYEPFISLQSAEVSRKPVRNKSSLYNIGIAGFCFANIMMLSFPEYFSGGALDPVLKRAFSWLILLLSLPALLIPAKPFFISAWKGIRQKILNIDAPISLAIIITFARSYYEIISGTGPGFLDSGTGIIFFMLAGRWFQEKTNSSLSFDRDHLSYFPLGTIIYEKGIERNIPVTQLKKGNEIIIRNGEIIPADAVLTSGTANIDYSFVTGESTPVYKEKGELLYAGGKQCGGSLHMIAAGAASQSYFTQLWNSDDFIKKKNVQRSFIHPWSQYFTAALFLIAAATSAYWGFHDASKIFPALTSVLIVACPCSLLLSATFTYGNMMRIFGRHSFYLKNAGVIEALASADTIVFDKTGTLTEAENADVRYIGAVLKKEESAKLRKAFLESSHPLSRVLAGHLTNGKDNYTTEEFQENIGAGIAAHISGSRIRAGSESFLKNEKITPEKQKATASQVFISIDDDIKGRFEITNKFRPGVEEEIAALAKAGYSLHLLSGDNAAEKNKLASIFGSKAAVQFLQSPSQKLEYIKALQQQGKKVIMLGDGLNDAGALMQADAGIAVNENSAQFTPACDAIISGDHVSSISKILHYAKAGKRIVAASFILSILYNVAGLSFATTANLSPVVAAILMPVSSISIILFVTAAGNLYARIIGLRSANKKNS